MTAKELGVKVLTTIENLISEIDKPSPLASGRRPDNRDSLPQIEEFDRYRVYSKMSYDYRKKRTQAEGKLRDRAYGEEQPQEPFRVTNPATLKILQRKAVKPIHQRTQEILAKKDVFVRCRQLELEQQELHSMRPQLHTLSADDQAQRRYNQSDLECYREGIDEQNRERIRRRNMSKLELVKKEELKVPAVDALSRALSHQRNARKNYSQDVIQRMMQYNYEKSSRKAQLVHTRTQEEGNFEPVLCHRSIAIAQRLRNTRRPDAHSSHHHSHCQLNRTPDQTPQKPNPKKTSNNTHTDQSQEKPATKVQVRQISKSFKRTDKSRSVSPNQSTKVTPLREKKLNSITTSTAKCKQPPKKQACATKKKENQVTAMTKPRQFERQK